MGKLAVGAYLRTLREAKKLGREPLALQLKTSESLIESIEKGQTDTRGSLLLLMVYVLQGSPEQLTALMVNDRATADDGRHLAEEWLIQSKPAPPSHRTEVDELSQILASDQYRMGKWLGYGRRLVEEQQRD